MKIQLENSTIFRYYLIVTCHSNHGINTILAIQFFIKKNVRTDALKWLLSLWTWTLMEGQTIGYEHPIKIGNWQATNKLLFLRMCYNYKFTHNSYDKNTSTWIMGLCTLEGQDNLLIGDKRRYGCQSQIHHHSDVKLHNQTARQSSNQAFLCIPSSKPPSEICHLFQFQDPT